MMLKQLIIGEYVLGDGDYVNYFVYTKSSGELRYIGDVIECALILYRRVQSRVLLEGDNYHFYQIRIKKMDSKYIASSDNTKLNELIEGFNKISEMGLFL